MKSRKSSSGWLPLESVAFRWLLVPRLLGAFLVHISDCDETYNYWEPAHHLLYGGGFQTWEYSPTYALRSYGYILIHMFPLLATNTTNKLIAFYLVRVILAAVCALCEAYFYRAVAVRFGPVIARRTLLLLAGSCGMYIAAPAFLPSSFSMCLGMIALGAWFQREYTVAIFAVAVSSLVGWPFSAVLGIPIALDVVLYKRRPLLFIWWCLISFVMVSVPLVAIDSVYYGRPVLAPLNIVLYNVFGKGGPNLYGVEPLSYYLINGVLNFNVVFILALLAPLAVEFQTRPGIVHILQVFWEVLITVLGRGGSYVDTLKNILSAYQGNVPGAGIFIRSRDYRKVVQPMIIWMIIFFTRPHKEERFLFPIYPLFCLSAVVTLHLLPEILTVVLGVARMPRLLRRFFISHLPTLTLVVFLLLSLSRAVALHIGYGAPMDVYKSLNSHQILSFTEQFPEVTEVNVCVGKEWHRFPSSFFLPNNKWNLRFLESDFKGQLPGLYSRHDNSTSVIPDHMNDLNREEPSRYFHLEKCHFLVDLDLPKTTPLQPRYSQDTGHWETVVRRPFLDTRRSHRLFRAFYVPWLSAQYTHYADYVLLRNKLLFVK
ncbi:Alpha-1,2-mannosyltransferase ALG9 [Geodia barretti]|uniref:Mannosyltransferase n=1 Tax=Geodia barretti TaxID=519541 RepID=A0AA35X287_GEOBA|nr:Alpha-1,2-mannosyltransferase ALG9 [Geodia barretti]